MQCREQAIFVISTGIFQHKSFFKNQKVIESSLEVYEVQMNILLVIS